MVPSLSVAIEVYWPEVAVASIGSEPVTGFAHVDPEGWVIDREKTAALLENTRKLLSEFEVKILGYYLDGLTCREIAETVGKSHKSVDNAVQRLRRKIARQLLSGDISKG